MQLKQWLNNYNIPPYSYIRTVTVKQNDFWRLCTGVSVNEIQNRGELALGLPTYYALDNDKIIFWPTPDRDYEAKIQYAPPLMEF